MKLVKKIKVELTGGRGIKSVQRAFITIGELQRKYRLNMKEKDTVRYMSYNISPPEAKTTILNFLNQEDKRAKKASKSVSVSVYHDVLMCVAQQFAESHRLGLRAKGKAGGTGDKGDKVNGANKRTPGDSTPKAGSKDDDGDKSGKVFKGKCTWCDDGPHKLKKCPTIPKEYKAWP